MDICGYHLRCLNNGSKCFDCRHQDRGQNKDYRHDALNVWPKGKESELLSEPAFSQSDDALSAQQPQTVSFAP